MASVCIDASLAISWFLPEDLSERAYTLREGWVGTGVELIAPPILAAEVPSTLRQAVYRGRINADEGDEAFAAFLDIPIRIIQPEGLLQRAWDIGKRANAPRLYDVFYVALAEIERCELWTADRRLVNLLGSRFPNVHWIGEA